MTNRPRAVALIALLSIAPAYACSKDPAPTTTKDSPPSPPPSASTVAAPSAMPSASAAPVGEVVPVPPELLAKPYGGLSDKRDYFYAMKFTPDTLTLDGECPSCSWDKTRHATCEYQVRKVSETKYLLEFTKCSGDTMTKCKSYTMYPGDKWGSFRLAFPDPESGYAWSNCRDVTDMKAGATPTAAFKAGKPPPSEAPKDPVAKAGGGSAGGDDKGKVCVADCQADMIRCVGKCKGAKCTDTESAECLAKQTSCTARCN